MSDLLTGCGGGYDPIGGIPLWEDLIHKRRLPIFANFSFNKQSFFDDMLKIGIIKRHTKLCYSVDASKIIAVINTYFPEYYLSKELNVPVYIISRNGTVNEVIRAYNFIISRNKRIDTVYAIEGGCDAILRGDEEHLGTPAEDMMNLKALMALKIKHKYLYAIGINIDTADGIKMRDIEKRLNELEVKNVIKKKEKWTLSAKNIQKYKKIVELCKPEDTIVQSLVVASLEHRGKYTPKHLKTRIGESTVELTDLTHTCIHFDLRELVSTMSYIDYITGDMTYEDIDDFINNFILGNGFKE